LSSLEEEFINTIDARFPYDSELSWKDLIGRAAKLSPNAAFAVLHEICRPPHSIRTTPDQLKRMINYWRRHFDHPIASVIEEAAVAMIEGRDLPVQDVIDRMWITAKHPNLYAALAILYMSCNDPTDRLEPIYDGIIQAWKAASDKPRK